MPSSSSATRSEAALQPRLRSRIEELRALIPELSDVAHADGIGGLACDLLDLLEAKQRQLIQENVRLASLRELTEVLLRDPQEERVLRTISLYLRQAHGFMEVIILTRSAGGGLRGYRACAGIDGFCEAIDWPADAIAGTPWAAALEGKASYETDRKDGATGLLKPLPVILPLKTVAHGDSHGLSASDDASHVTGLLGLRPGGATGNPAFDIEQLAFLTATLLDGVQHQRQALRDRQFRECLLESMDDGLIALDGVGAISAANRAAHLLLGMGEGTLIGKPIDVLTDRAPQIAEIGQTCLRDRSRLAHIEVWIASDVERIPIRLSVVPLEEEASEDAGGIVVTLSDLRPLRAMEEELRRLDRLAALGRFATSVAHEIRNPLAAIGAGVEFLAGSLECGKEADVNLLRSEINRLDRIVTDLLEPVRRQPLLLQEVVVRELVERACETVSPLAEEKSVSLRILPGAEEPKRPMVQNVDRDRLLQVLINLIRNAVEASPQESTVDVGWGREESDPPRDRIWVRDRGCGIKEDQLERVFEPFYSTKSAGTGLGLYVSNGVVEQHGGKLQVESLPGGGTRATVSLPSPSG